jgi:hypothetical protein
LIHGWDLNNILFNDGECNSCATNYICSTNFKDPGSDAYARSWLDIKAADGNAVSGSYTIKPSNTVVDVYCDMTTDGGGYDFYEVSAGLNTCAKTNPNSCPDGMDIWVARTKNHWESALSFAADTSYLSITGISKPSGGCGGCTSYAMNSGVSEQSAWEAIDGGSWWIRNTTYIEPSGDY